MRRPCCFRVQRAWSQRPPVSSASSWKNWAGAPVDPQARVEFTTLCSKHLFTTLDSAWEHVLPGPGPRLACPCSPQDRQRAGQSGTPTAGWTLLRPTGGLQGSRPLASRAARVAQRSEPDAGIRPWATGLQDRAAMSPYLLQKTLSILTGHLHKCVH